MDTMPAAGSLVRSGRAVYRVSAEPHELAGWVHLDYVGGSPKLDAMKAKIPTWTGQAHPIDKLRSVKS